MRKTGFAKKEYQEIADHFAIGRVERVTFIKKGIWVPKAVVHTAEDAYVVSAHVPNTEGLLKKTRESLETELALLDHLEDLPVQHFLRGADGEHIFLYKGVLITVDVFIHGGEPKRITPKMAKALGVFLGDFHIRGSTFKKSLAARRNFYDLSLSVMRSMAPFAYDQADPKIKAVVEEVRRGVERHRLPKALPKGPVHVDVKPGNELFLGEQLSGIVDFGNFYRDAFVLDVAKTIMWNCASQAVPAAKLDAKLVTAFLKAYESRRPLSAVEKKSLHRAVLFAIYSHIWVDLYHLPLGYVPKQYVRYLIDTFLPLARALEKKPYAF